VIITTSWDDGYPADIRLAELLEKYNIAGTFYVPCRNSEGRAVITGSNVRELSRGFEIAAHTLDHVDLTTVAEPEAERQICEGKQRLEDMLGAEVSGFCYPRGHYSRRIREITMDAGFVYARGIKNFCSNVGHDPFAMPVTLQFFPHKNDVYLRNLLKHGLDSQRLRVCFAAISTANLVDRAKRIVDLCADSIGVFHLWGHSWEIEEHKLWRDLEDVLKYLRQTFPQATFATSLKIMERSPSENSQTSASNLVRNYW
jgi:peptidoglycan/xylan/chitin deacetylase (PgdA/CDA1 family)